jgi:hypothetical protein
MDEPRKRTLRYAFGVLAIAVALATVFAATALARGGNRASPATPGKAKTRTVEAPAKTKAYSGRHHCDLDHAASSQDV